MNIRKDLLLFLSVLGFLSCSDSSDPVPSGVDGSLIRLRSETLSAGLVSRSPFGVGSDGAFTALVPSVRTDGVVGLGYVDGLHALGTMTFNGGSAPVSYDLASLGDDADVKSTFPSGNQVWVFGLYPGNKDAWALTNTSASTSFTGKDDIMAAGEVLVKRSDVDAENYPSLSFAHLLTRLEVKLKAKDENAIASVGSIKSIRLVADGLGSSRVKDELTFSPVTGETTFSESASLTAFPFYKASATGYTDTPYADQSYVLTTSASLQAYSLVAPTTADAINETEYFLAIEREGGNIDYAGFDLLQADNVTPFAGSTAGWVFTVTLTYSKQYIETIEAVVSGTMGVQDWKDGDGPIDLAN